MNFSSTPPSKVIKRQLRSLLRAFGIDVRRYRSEGVPGSDARRVGDIESFLQDLRSRGFTPRGILDVGANRGDWTRLALRVFPGAKVILFEPQAEMVDPLEALCRENTNLFLVKAAAGRQPGQLYQTIWDDLAGSSFLPLEDPALRDQGKQRLTPVVTIDSVLADRPHFSPDLVKLDIQGFELEALAGASSVFGIAELMVLEVSLYEFMPKQPILREVITFMGDHGYEVYDVPGFLRRPFDGALGQTDIAFAR